MRGALIGHVIVIVYLLFVCVELVNNKEFTSELLNTNGNGGGRQLPVEAIVEVLATIGETIVLPCDPSSHKYFFLNSSVKWFKDGEAVQSTAAGRFYWMERPGPSGKASSRNIRISDVSKQDGGVWQCKQVAASSQPKHRHVVSQPIKLIIASVPNHPILMQGDKKYLEGSTLTVTEDSDLTVSCLVRYGNPPSRRVDWLLDDLDVTSSSRLYQEKERDQDGDEYQVTRSVINLRVVRSSNKKVLHCVAHHPLWTSADPSVYVVLDVIYKPSFVLSRSPGFGFPIIEGTKVSLHCKINSNPPSLPYWVKDKSRSSATGSSSSRNDSIVMTDASDDKYKDGYLNFSSINRKDSGWYRCSTDHKLGHFTSFGYFLSVKHAPQIVSSPPRTMEAELGDDVMLECGATGSPAPSYCWSRMRGRHRHRNKQLQPSTDQQERRLESLGLEQRLVLDRVLYSDTGTYKCSVSNRIGNSHRRAHSHDVRLTVKGRPTVEPINRTVRVMLGRPASLSVQVCANPAPHRLHWIVGYVAITPERSLPGYKATILKESNMADCYLSSLEIESVGAQDGGQVIVVVRNSKGVNDGVILVNLTTASYSVSAGPSVNFHRRLNAIRVTSTLLAALLHTRWLTS